MGWEAMAACREACRSGQAEPGWWFPSFPASPGELRRAKEICAGCPSRAECHDHAVKHRLVGVWGGVAFGHRSVREVERTCSECGLVFEAPPVAGRRRETCGPVCAKRRHDKQKRAHDERRGVAVGEKKAAGHGTISRYHRGCKCRACRRAAREHRARYRQPAERRLSVVVVAQAQDDLTGARNDARNAEQVFA